MNKKQCVALVLAGGQGSRLGILTSKLAKPAVPFGGKYRIIDFTLSNCANSGIDTVGVLTQYEPLILNSYIGVGSHWGLDRKNGGVTVLPPYATKSGARWYMGTADAIHQNMDYIDIYDPEYVLILSGDHIYKMDYSLMLDEHIKTRADLTIAAMTVKLEEASRFGIIITNPLGEIVEFQEKPDKPKSDLASMGVYVFTWSKLKEYLKEDSLKETTSHDFGKDIIPTMLGRKERLYAYKFNSYWKDVGTIESFWEANMDLLDDSNKLNLNDRQWKVYSVNPTMPPHYIGNSSNVSNSLITEGCSIEGDMENSVVFPGVVIEKGAIIRNSVIMTGATIEENSIVDNCIIGEETTIGKYSILGMGEGKTITVVGENITIKPYTKVKKGEVYDHKSLAANEGGKVNA